MAFFLLAVNALIMLLLPVGLGIWLAARWRAPWRLFGIGAATFVLSQVGHIPFNGWVLNPRVQAFLGTEPAAAGFGRILLVALLFGLSAGLFEETARYLVYRFWIPEARIWRDGMMFGAGHGGLEAIILGALALQSLANIYLIHTGQAGQLVTPEQADQLAAAQTQVAALLNGPWYNLLVGGIERILTICTHLALALLVLQTFVRGRWYWLAAAIGWHMLSNTVAVMGSFLGWTPLGVEGALSLVALGSLAIIRALYQPLPQPAESDA